MIWPSMSAFDGAIYIKSICEEKEAYELEASFQKDLREEGSPRAG